METYRRLRITNSIVTILNLIIGAGIANKSLDVDGISETIGTTQSAMYGGASAQILQINDDIDELLKGLQSYFGTNMVAI